MSSDMNDYIFNKCTEAKTKSQGRTPFWRTLFEQFKSEGFNFKDSEDLRDKYRKQCKKRGIKFEFNTMDDKANIHRLAPKNSAKILLLDVENSPLLAFTWGLYDQNISYNNVVEDWHLLCWSAKWLFSPEVMSDVLTVPEAKKHDDKRIAESMWKLMDEASIIIAHNGNQFDLKKLNARFIKHGLKPTSSYQTVDTLLVARNTFNFTSNKLDDLCTYFGITGKSETNFDLWKQCFYADKDALDQMVSYCRNDSSIMEEVYLKLRPWIKGHPNLNLWDTENTSVCPNCGGEITFGGDYYTPMNRYKEWRCKGCGAIGRSKKSNLDKEKSKLIVR